MTSINPFAPLRLATIAAFAVAMSGCSAQREPVKDAATESADTRTLVALPAAEQEAVRHEMRAMLGALNGVMAATASRDTAALFAALAPAGMAAAADPAIEEMLPPEWRELAEQVHAGFDSIAVAVRQARETSAVPDTVLTRLVRVTAACSSCHSTYRLHAP